VNWEALGALGEIVGSVAVVVTIAYLAVQMRESRRFAKSASANQSRAAVNDFLRGLSDNNEIARIYSAGLKDRSALEDHERLRFDLVIFQMLRITETAYLEHQDGFISAEIWESQWRQAQPILRTIGGMESWSGQKGLVSVSFMQWVDGHLEDTSPRPVNGRDEP